MYYVYGLVDPVKDEIFYVGKGSGLRWKSHFKETQKGTSNLRKWRRIQKIRREGAEAYVVFFSIDMEEDDALEFETFVIRLFGRKKIDPHGILMNLVEDGNPPKIRRPMSAATKAKIGENSRRCLTGRKQSQETIDNRRRALLGRPKRKMTEEEKQAHGRRMRGRKLPPCSETRKARISDANSGAKNGMFGSTHSSAAKAAIAQANRDDRKKYEDEIRPVIEGAISRLVVRTQAALAALLNEEGVTTRQGKKWKNESICYALKQMGIRFGQQKALPQ